MDTTTSQTKILWVLAGFFTLISLVMLAKPACANGLPAAVAIGASDPSLVSTYGSATRKQNASAALLIPIVRDPSVKRTDIESIDPNREYLKNTHPLDAPAFNDGVINIK